MLGGIGGHTDHTQAYFNTNDTHKQNLKLHEKQMTIKVQKIKNPLTYRVDFRTIN